MASFGGGASKKSKEWEGMLINETGWFKRRKMLKNDEKQQAFFVLCQVDIFAKYPRVLLVSDWKDDVLEKNQTWLGKLEMRKKKKKSHHSQKKTSSWGYLKKIPATKKKRHIAWLLNQTLKTPGFHMGSELPVRQLN